MARKLPGRKLNSSATHLYSVSILTNLPCSGKNFTMYRRALLNTLLEALSDTPVIFLRGARQSGKSTLGCRCAGRTDGANDPLAARIGTLHNQSEISRSSGIPNSTLTRYLSLLKSTFLIQELPAWSTNLGKRLVKSPKLFMVDTGLTCALLGMDAAGLKQGSEIAGRVFENFVVLEVFKHASWSEKLVRLYHFRSQRGQEVDIVLEDSQGQVVGIEVKLSATPSPKDFSGLKTLQEHLGKRFIRGVLVYTGREVVPFGERMHAVPFANICTF